MNNINTKALLVKISIGQFNPKRSDDKTTQEVLDKHGATKEAGAWVKNLINPKHLEAVTRKAMRARQEHYKYSLPWADEGYRILPVKMFVDYQEAIKEVKDEFQQETEKFIELYPSYVYEAKSALNGMFDPKQYPSQQSLRDKFYFDISFLPFPDSNDFRCNLSQSSIEDVKDNLDECIAEAQKTAIRDLWMRLKTPIKHMVEKLSDEKGMFKNSMIENLQSIIELIPKLNLVDDPVLNQFAKEAEMKLIANPQDLRNNPDIRKDVAKEAENLLKRMEGYL